MPYDQALATRIRAYVADTPLLIEKKMFGGIGWTIGGHMAAGAHSTGELMIRCSKDDWPAFIAEPGAGAMERGGKGMSGWVLIDASTVVDDADLHRWLERGCAYAGSMPPKKKKG